jgi:hypothetical protein
MSQQQPSEEEIRAAMEAEMARVRVEDVVLQAVVSLVNLGARRAGLAPGTEGERDLGQVQTAIDAARALLPVIEPRAPEQAKAIRDAVSQLQMAYVQAGGDQGAAPEEAQPPPAEEPKPETGEEGPGPAQSSGRLWIPGQ